MATFSMKDLVDSVFGSATNARQIPQNFGGEEIPMAGRRGKRSAEQTMALILEFIAQAKEPVTILQICDHINRKPAPHFRAMLRDLEQRGVIKRTEDFGAGPLLARYLYSLSDR